MAEYAIAVCVHGLRDPDTTTNGNPVVFCQGDLTGGLAASINSLLGTSTLKHWIPAIKGQVSGFGIQADPRNPIGEAQPIRVRIRDVGGILGRLFCEELGSISSFQSWRLRDNELTRAQTSFDVFGDVNPTVNGIYWINDEAVKVTGVVTSNGVHTLTVTRAVCGSRARRHRLKPRTYTDGGGFLQRMYLTNKPDFDRQKFPVTIWQQSVEGNTAQAVITWRRGYLTQRPKPIGDAFELQIEDFTKILKAAVIGNGKPEVSGKFAVHVFNAERMRATNGYVGGIAGDLGVIVQTVLGTLGASPGTMVEGVQPRLVEFTFTAEEVEKIFGPILHVGTDPALDATLTAAFIADVTPCIADISGPCELRLFVDSGGWVGTFRILSIERQQTGYGPSGSPQASTGLSYRLIIKGELAECFEGTLGEDAVVQQVNFGIDDEEPSPLAEGFSIKSNDPIPPGSEGPKITLEWAFQPITFFRACLSWFTSDQAKASDLNGVYDDLPCWALDFDPAAFDIGTAGTEPNIDPATSEFLRLAQLQPQKFTYPIRMGDKLGELLHNEALRAMVLWSASPTTGKFGFRQMYRPYPGGASELVVETGSKESIIQPGNRLPPVNQLRVEVGYKGKDRSFQDFRVLTLQDGINDALDSEKVYEQKIRVWSRSNFSNTSPTAAALPRLANFYFRILRNSPAVYKQPTSIARGAHRGADFVLWSNDKLQNANGRGFSSIVAMVVGVDNDYASGRENLIVLPYALAHQSAINGFKGPALLLIGKEVISAPTQYRCFVRVIGDRNQQNLETAYNGLYPNLVNERLRLETPSAHNPMPGDKERRGKLEASFQLDDVGTNKSGLNWLDITFDSNWDRGTLSIDEDLLVVNKTRLLLSDFREASSNIEGNDILPPTFQGPEETAIVVYAPTEPDRPLHDTFYKYQ